MPRSFIGILTAMTLSACAFTPHEVEITAQAPTDASSVGAGISLYLEVIDDRDSPVTGQRGAGMQGADITAPQIMAALERELTAGFEAKGFQVLSTDAGADVDVEARLRAFKFFIETGFFVGAENTSVVIGVEAKRLSDDYDRTYRASNEEAAMFVPAGSSIDEKLNAALSAVLAQIMSDEKLMAFLARMPEAS
ncbi:MAG: YajG family lipoprotein [Paracoccaceae bacterium]